MNRNFSSKSIILTHRRFGEKNLLVKLFAQQFGIIDVVAYGAQSANSALRVVNTIGGVGMAYLYLYKNRSLNKLSEFELESNQGAVVDNILYFLYASLWTEVLIATFASGSEYHKSFVLLRSALIALRCCVTEVDYLLATARFLWRYLHINGISPHIDSCVRCATTFAADATMTVVNSHAYCERCYAHLSGQLTAATATVQRYPARLIDFFVRDARVPFAHVAADRDTIAIHNQIFRFTMVIIEDVIGRRLKSLPVIFALRQSQSIT